MSGAEYDVVISFPLQAYSHLDRQGADAIADALKAETPAATIGVGTIAGTVDVAVRRVGGGGEHSVIEGAGP